MGEEIPVEKLLSATSKLASAAEKVAPNNPTVQIIQELKGAAVEAKNAFLAAKDALIAKKELGQIKAPIQPQKGASEVWQQTNPEAGRIAPNTQQAQRIEPAKPPTLKTTEVLRAFMKWFDENKDEELLGVKVRELTLEHLFDKIVAEPEVMAAFVSSRYNKHFDKILDYAR